MSNYKTIGIRVSKETPSAQEIDNAAQRLGISKNKLVTEGIKIMCGLDKASYDEMIDFFKRKQDDARAEFTKKFFGGI